MRTAGISNEGASAEAVFRKLTGATKPPKAADGDAEINGHRIEVKKASTNTINQVRAVKYLTLVVWSTHHDECWYVVPADEVVRLVFAKNSRGQHTENAFESATLSTAKLKDDFRVTNPTELRQRVIAAAEAAKANEELMAAMNGIREECAALAKRSRAVVGALIPT